MDKLNNELLEQYALRRAEEVNRAAQRAYMERDDRKMQRLTMLGHQFTDAAMRTGRFNNRRRRVA